MIAFFKPSRSPIGVDIGTRSVKLVQLSADGQQILETGRWDLPIEVQPGSPDYNAKLVDALKQAREGKEFHGRDAVVCLSPRQYVVQNVRVPKSEGPQLEAAVAQEALPRLPFPANEADWRFIEATDIRQADGMKREVIVLACHRPVLNEMLQIVEDSGLLPVAVEIEPTALMRVYQLQYRRESDQNARSIYAHVGNTCTAVFVAQGDELLFVKNVELGGKHFDEAVSKHLHMPVSEAWALRRHNGDRRA